ncbi:TrkH family potassium uptake protein [Metamycoplasma canadense]|uniref:Potassium uptake protein KtrB n=1 Tax=Metamycoplasma canadense TaxID=29554 RepID=A0A077LBW0_9BACT|nr:potassium transporter TrkG [Metamycoplasma canadense]BAP39609.1 potassium uptake protein KtrB [Metamycoplasma canadense]
MKNKKLNPKKTNIVLRFLRKLGAVRYIFIIYILFTILISLLLFWNVSHKSDLKEPIKYIDALFVSSSAFSDTGLTPVVILNTFNSFGQFLIAISMVVGGIGIFTFKIYIFQSILGLKSNIFSNTVSQTERGAITVSETRKMIKIAISFLIISTIIASFIFTMILYLKPNNNFITEELAKKTNPLIFNNKVVMKANEIPYNNFFQSLKLGIFHAISSINNAGFDLFGNKSLQPFYNDYTFQLVTIITFLIGGIGFPVIYDIWKKIESLKKDKPRHRFQLFTKFTIITYLSTTVLGFALTAILEYSSKSKDTFWYQEAYGNVGDKLFAIYFQVSSTRSAGFSTVDYINFTHSTILLHSILMFIGFSPVSTAGGIRNTTVAVIFLSLVTMLTGRKKINAFKRQIGKETLIKAVNVFALAIVLVFAVTIISYSTLPKETKSIDNTHLPMIFVLFEACSAFGNTGLSTGLSSGINNLHIAGKLSLITIMITGQFGILQTIRIFGREKSKPEHYQYIYEDVSVG